MSWTIWTALFLSHALPTGTLFLNTFVSICPQSLENWDASDPQSLVILINELVSQYKEHQRKQVEQIPRIHFEYTTLAADNNYPEFEVHVIRGQQVRVGSFGQTTCKPSPWDALTCKQAPLSYTCKWRRVIWRVI